MLGLCPEFARNLSRIPDPSLPCFFGKKSVENPRKKQGFSAGGTPKILGKERQNAQKSKEDQKTEEARKSKKARIGGSGICSELGVRSQFARNSLGKRPGPAMCGTLQGPSVEKKEDFFRKVHHFRKSQEGRNC